MADGLADGHLRRQRREPVADVGHDGLAVARTGFEVHVDLGRVHAFGVFVQLGPAGAPAHLGHLGHLADERLGHGTHAVGFCQGGAWLHHHAQHQ